MDSEMEELRRRMTTLESVLHEHLEDAARYKKIIDRHGEFFDQQKPMLETIVDRIDGLFREHAESKRREQERDQAWLDEKGALVLQVARDAKQVNARFDQLTQNDIEQNTKIAKIEASISGLREAATIVIEEATERRIRAKDDLAKQAGRDKLLKNIETYSKAILAISMIVSSVWAAFQFASTHFIK